MNFSEDNAARFAAYSKAKQDKFRFLQQVVALTREQHLNVVDADDNSLFSIADIILGKRQPTFDEAFDYFFATNYRNLVKNGIKFTPTQLAEFTGHGKSLQEARAEVLKQDREEFGELSAKDKKKIFSKVGTFVMYGVCENPECTKQTTELGQRKCIECHMILESEPEESEPEESAVPESAVPESAVPESVAPESEPEESVAPESEPEESEPEESVVPESAVPESAVPVRTCAFSGKRGCTVVLSAADGPMCAAHTKQRCSKEMKNGQSCPKVTMVGSTICAYHNRRHKRKQEPEAEAPEAEAPAKRSVASEDVGESEYNLKERQRDDDHINTVLGSMTGNKEAATSWKFRIKCNLSEAQQISVVVSKRGATMSGTMTDVINDPVKLATCADGLTLADFASLAWPQLSAERRGQIHTVEVTSGADTERASNVRPQFRRLLLKLYQYKSNAFKN